jgi:hypothetical protein
VAALAASLAPGRGTDEGGRVGGAPPAATPAEEGPGVLPAPRPEAPRADHPPLRYAPKSAEPADAIPGGSLLVHEGPPGGHTLERHVGKSLEDLRRRADREGKREVSTFPDLETANRAVAEALYSSRAAIVAWLAGAPSDQRPFERTLRSPVGTVYRANAGRGVPGRTVVVVLRPSSRFAEGFSIVTAYVGLP